MEIRKIVIISILLILHNFPIAFSYNSTDVIIDAKKLLQDGSILSDTSLIYHARDILLRAYSNDSTFNILYFIAQSEYELARLAFAHKQNELFETHYDKAVKYIEKLIKDKYDWSEPHALLSLLYGYRIAQNSLSAVTKGPKAYFLAKRAIELDNQNPRAWFVMGTVKLHMPEIFGGGIDKSISAFKKAIELYTQQHNIDSLSPDWGHIDALLWLGWAYEKNNEINKALEIYKETLNLYPRANWIISSFIEPLQKQRKIN